MSIDPAYYQLSDDQKGQYLSATDKDYQGLQPDQQAAYRQHLETFAPPKPSAGQQASDRYMASPGRNINPATLTEKLLSKGLGKVLPESIAPGQDALEKFGYNTGAAALGGGAAAAIPRLAAAAPTLAPMLGRAAGTGALAAATNPGDRVASGAKAAGWSLAGDAALQGLFGLAKGLGGTGFGKRAIEGATPKVATPAGPPTQTVTGTALLHDTGSQQPPGSPFAPKAIVNPGSGQAEGVVNTPAVERLLAQHGIPPSEVPAKDLLVTRATSAGTPAVPENLLSRILRTGAPSGAAQDPAVQQGIALGGAKLLEWLKAVGSAAGIGRDPNLTKAGGGG